MLYTAKITGNKRDVGTTSPKSLLIDINPAEGLFRNNCWVDSELVASIAPKGHQKPRLIEFEADLKEYRRRGTETSYTLTNIRNIRRIK